MCVWKPFLPTGMTWESRGNWLTNEIEDGAGERMVLGMLLALGCETRGNKLTPLCQDA